MKLGLLFPEAPEPLAAIEVEGLSADSRQITPGMAFVALAGTLVDAVVSARGWKAGARRHDDAAAAGDGVAEVAARLAADISADAACPSLPARLYLAAFALSCPAPPPAVEPLE